MISFVDLNIQHKFQMTFVEILVEKIKKVYAITDEFAVGSYIYIEPLDKSNLAEFACSVSSKLGMENWFLCAEKNHFVLEIDECFMVVYFADDRLDNATEFVVRRCNTEEEYQVVLDAI